MQKSLTGGAYQAPGFLPRQTNIQEVLAARGLTPGVSFPGPKGLNLRRVLTKVGVIWEKVM